MIEIGTRLEPRAKDDFAARVVGVEASRYMLRPADHFGSTFAMGFDEISSAYDCSAYAVAIEPFDEQKSWRELSATRFQLHAQDARKREVEAAELPSPEMVFKAAAEAEAKTRGARR
jgi:hypothetical protein